MKQKLINFTIFLPLLLTLSCREIILHDLEEFQANEIQVILNQEKIETKKERNGSKWNLSVAKKNAEKALFVMQEARVLKRSNEVPQKQKSFLQSNEDKQIQYLEMLSESLAQTLERFPGVIEARVHLFKQNFFNINIASKNSNKSASVMIVASQEAAIEKNLIKRLVSGAAGIPLELVEVIVVSNDFKRNEQDSLGVIAVKANIVKDTANQSYTIKNIDFVEKFKKNYLGIFFMGSLVLATLSYRQKNKEKYLRSESGEIQKILLSKEANLE